VRVQVLLAVSVPESASTVCLWALWLCVCRYTQLRPCLDLLPEFKPLPPWPKRIASIPYRLENLGRDPAAAREEVKQDWLTWADRIKQYRALVPEAWRGSRGRRPRAQHPRHECRLRWLRGGPQEAACVGHERGPCHRTQHAWGDLRPGAHSERTTTGESLSF